MALWARRESECFRFFIAHYGYIGSKDGWAESANMQREAPFPLVHGFRLSARSSRTLLGSVEVSWGPQFLGSTVCLRKHPGKESQGLKHPYPKNRRLPSPATNSPLLRHVAS